MMQNYVNDVNNLNQILFRFIKYVLKKDYHLKNNK